MYCSNYKNRRGFFKKKFFKKFKTNKSFYLYIRVEMYYIIRREGLSALESGRISA